MAITTRHQNDLIAQHRQRIAPEDWIEISFEETVHSPRQALARFESFTGLRRQTTQIAKTVDVNRCKPVMTRFSRQEVDHVVKILGPEPVKLPAT